jgi:hypothetical protein
VVAENVTVFRVGVGRDTRAPADLVGSATLWAVTVTVCDVRILDGAVYRPAEEIVPTEGLIDQVTAVLLAPRTVGVNCCVPEGAKLTADGLRDIVTAWRSMITAVAVFEGSAMLVAVIVTLWVVGVILGAT